MTRWRVPGGSYERFRCGLSFTEVRRELAAEQRAAADRGDRMFVRRAAVLGRMRQYKLQAYEFSTRVGAS